MRRFNPWVLIPVGTGVSLQIVAALRLAPMLGFRAVVIGIGLLLMAWICSRRTEPSPLARLFLALLVVAIFWIGVLEVWLSFTTPLALGLLCLAASSFAHLTLTLSRLRSPGTPSDRGRVFVRLGLLLSVTALLAAAIEAGFRLLIPASIYEIVPDRVGDICLVLGEDGILHATPGFRGRYIHPEFPNLRVEINADGFRDGLDESAANHGTTTPVLLLGDSQAFGTGVELSETFQERLEQQAATIVESGLTIYCAALPGDGQVQQLDRLNRWAPIVKPKLVIVALYEGNDFRNNVRVGGRRHGLLPSPSPERVQRHHLPKPPGPMLRRFLGGVTRAPFWLGSSSAVQFLQPTVESRLAKLGWLNRRAPMNRFLSQLLEREPPGLVQIATQYTFDLLKEIEARSRQAGADLLILVIPSAVQADSSRFQSFLSTIPQQRRGSFDRTTFHDRLVRELGGLGFRVVDPLASLEQAVGRRHSPFHNEGHLNSRGHVILADQLAPLLKELLRDPR